MHMHILLHEGCSRCHPPQHPQALCGEVWQRGSSTTHQLHTAASITILLLLSSQPCALPRSPHPPLSPISSMLPGVLERAGLLLLSHGSHSSSSSASSQQGLLSALCRQLAAAAAAVPATHSCCPTARYIAHAAALQASAPGAAGGSADNNNSSSAGSAFLARQRQQHASSRGAAPPSLSSTLQQQPAAAVVQQWQSIAQLSPADGELLLSQHPRLRSYLSNSQLFQASNYCVNVACLSLHPDQLAAQHHAALRGVLALVPPSMLRPLLEELPPLAHQHQQQQQALSAFQDRLLHMLGPFRPLQQPQSQEAEQQQGSAWLQQQVQQQPQRSLPSSFQQVAEAVVRAVGLRPHDCPTQIQSLDGQRVLQLLERAERRALDSAGSTTPPGSPTASSSLSSSSLSSSSSNSSIGSLNSTARNVWTNAMSAPTVGASLTRVLEVTSRARNLWYKPLHDADAAAQFARQLQAAAGLGQGDVLCLLLQRPSMLWQHNTPTPPGQLLSHLAQLLPDLAQHNRLAQLVLKQPRLLTCSPADLQAAADMLSTRLQLSQPEAASLVLRHPQLLVQPVARMAPNIGFMVGLGMTPSDLRAMALKSPKWVTSSLRDLTVQWHFVQQVLKVSRQDLVLFPQLLTLPISTCLGPRVLYARKRNVKLLNPSAATLLGHTSGSSTAQAQAWSQQHKTVPLEAWLSVPEQRMCSLMGLDVQDFKRFKPAWSRVYGGRWERYSLKGRQAGQQQLVLSGVSGDE